MDAGMLSWIHCNNIYQITQNWYVAIYVFLLLNSLCTFHIISCGLILYQWQAKH